jgi:hypothetical protein
MRQHIFKVQLVAQVAADRAAGVVLDRGLVRLDRVARRQEPNPPAAFKQTECGGFPSRAVLPVANKR